MGEFSRRHIATRQAEPGEELVLTTFGNGTVRGFAAAADPKVAVALPPGTEIRFAKPVATEAASGTAPAIATQLARIRHVIVDNPSVHHDALDFAGAPLILLTQLCVGQSATVVRLPAPAAIGRPFRSDNRHLSLDEIRLLTEPADDSGHPLFI
jgi:hypothetical protein